MVPIPVIVIPVLNRYDLLERCLDSIDFSVDEIIIIDNGQNLDGGMFTISSKKLDDTKIYSWSMPSNLGVATSWNLGIKATPFARGWILLNSDAYFAEGELEKFWRTCHVDEIQLGGTPGWACAWIGSQVVKDVGLFCEAFHPAYFEDNDYERRAIRLGKTITKSDAVIHHDNSSTLLSDVRYQSKNQNSFNANLELFKLRNARLDAGQWDLQRRLNLGWD